MAEAKKDTATIYVMGKAYRVPNTLTIMEAMEYAGYRFIRGCGCRGGFCGACTTFYRMKDDYNLYVDLACQKMVENGMYMVQPPFIPAGKPRWNLDEMEPTAPSVPSMPLVSSSTYPGCSSVAAILRSSTAVSSTTLSSSTIA